MTQAELVVLIVCVGIGYGVALYAAFRRSESPRRRRGGMYGKDWGR